MANGIITDSPVCVKCGVTHSRFRDAAHTKPAAYCRACHSAYMRETRPAYRDLAPEQRRKAITRAYTNVLKQRGKLSKAPCENCGAAESESHHDDYNNPRLVRWLCRSCHSMFHVEHHV